MRTRAFLRSSSATLRSAFHLTQPCHWCIKSADIPRDTQGCTNAQLYRATCTSTLDLASICFQYTMRLGYNPGPNLPPNSRICTSTRYTALGNTITKHLFSPPLLLAPTCFRICSAPKQLKIMPAWCGVGRADQSCTQTLHAAPIRPLLSFRLHHNFRLHHESKIMGAPQYMIQQPAQVQKGIPCQCTTEGTKKL